MREAWVDSVKGFGIVLVVVGHVILGILDAKMFTNFKFIMEYIIYFIYSFHMPLFFIISGYLYSKTWHINNLKEYKDRMVNKVIALYITYVVFCLSYSIVKFIMSNSTNSKIGLNKIISVLFKPIGPYWYLYTLIGLFIVIPYLDLKITNKKKILISSFILMFISSYFSTPIAIINYTIKYMFYFYLGSILFNFKKYINKNSIFIISLIYLTVNVVYFYFTRETKITNVFVSTILAVTGSLIIIYLFKSGSIQNTLLNYLGKLSLPIFLIHGFLTSGLRIIFIKLGINSLLIHILAGTFLGIFIPIIIYKFSRRYKFLDFFFTPNKYIKI